jgi:hypothetical protein
MIRLIRPLYAGSGNYDFLRSTTSMAPGLPATTTRAPPQPDGARSMLDLLRMPIALHRPARSDLRYHRCLESAVLQWVATYGYFAIFGLLVLGIVGIPVPMSSC